MDDKTQGTEQQDQLSDMSRDELDAEIGRLLGVYPVVRFLDEREIEEDGILSSVRRRVRLHARGVQGHSARWRLPNA